MSVETIQTDNGTLTIETRPTGDGKGTAVTQTFTPNPGDPTVEALAVIEAVRDPKQPDPSVADRLAAIECLLVPPEA